MNRISAPDEPWAWFSGRLATGLAEVSDDPTALDRPGFWAVVAPFEGDAVFARFRHVRVVPEPPADPARWLGPTPDAWRSSLGEDAYRARVQAVRDKIAAGTVYQVNVCRVLQAPLPDGERAHVASLHAILATGNPAPYAAVVHLPDQGVRVVSASPELFLSRSGDLVRSGPIKGTGRSAADLRTKDVAENIMITDLVRNDIGRVARTGSVTVPVLCGVEEHPGLVHLVSYVEGRLRPDCGWGELLAATLPPGSVSGAPKSSALRIIRDVEPVPRGPYCGAVGWVENGSRGVLAVAIRTFWIVEGAGGPVLRFGTGAGIVWDSDPLLEWRETVLKARRLLALASAAPPGHHAESSHDRLR